MKAYITGFVRSGNTYTANGAAEILKEIVAQIKTDDLEILFRMDSGYIDDDIIATIESTGCQYLIKGKEYPTLASQVSTLIISLMKGDEARETSEAVTKLDSWDKNRRPDVSRELKPAIDRSHLSFLEDDDFQYFYFVTNTEMASEKVVISYENVAMLKNISRKPSMIWPLNTFYSDPFGPTKPSFS